MLARFPSSKAKIGVAVSFDERLENVLAVAARLARLTGSRLRLVHVCDPWTKSYLATAVEAGPPDLVNVLKEESARVATRRVASLARTLGDHVEVEVAAGDVVRCLAEDAEANGVGLIVVGASKGGAASTSMGFSTAVSLISEATVPVLVVNENALLSPTQEGLSIVVADDFSDVALDGLALGFALAQMVRGSTLVHAHVETYSDLQLFKRGKLPSAKVSPNQIAGMLQQAEEKLLARCGDRAGRLEVDGGHYQMEVVAGSVPDELERTAVACRADLTIFGQHRVFHRRAMHVGQVPFKAMLSQNRPVIVVPHAH